MCEHVYGSIHVDLFVQYVYEFILECACVCL